MSEHRSEAEERSSNKQSASLRGGAEGAPRSERVLGGVGTRMLFENDRVKVWELRLAPGEDSPPHRHELDHLLIQLSGDKVAVIPEPDTEGPYKEYMEADVIPGMTVFVGRGGVETARNVGAEPYREIIIELKD